MVYFIHLIFTKNKGFKMPLILPQKLVFVSTKRNNSMDGKLSFISYYSPDGTIAQEKAMNKWKDKDSKMVEMDNQPQSGFVVGSSAVHGLSYTPKFNVRIYSTKHDVEFEISMDNFLEIIKVSTLDKGYIKEECVLAWDKNQLVLLPVANSQYEALAKTSHTMFSNDVKTKDSYNFGDVFIIKSHKTKKLINQELIYLGLHDVPDFALKNIFSISNFMPINDNGTQFKLVYKTSPRHIFITLYAPISTSKTKYVNLTSKFIFLTEIDSNSFVYLGSKEDFSHYEIFESGSNNDTEVKFSYSEIDTKFKTCKKYDDFLGYIGKTNEELLGNVNYLRNIEPQRLISQFYNVEYNNSQINFFMSEDFKLYSITQGGYNEPPTIHQYAKIGKEIKKLPNKIKEIPICIRGKAMYCYKLKT